MEIYSLFIPNEDWHLCHQSTHRQLLHVLPLLCLGRDLLEITQTRNKHRFQTWLNKSDKLFLRTYFSRYSKADYFTETIIEQFIETKQNSCWWRFSNPSYQYIPSDFTCCNIHSTLWHNTHTTLRIRWWISIYIMNIGCFRCIFKISNCRITLEENLYIIKVAWLTMIITFPQRKIRPVSSS